MRRYNLSKEYYNEIICSLRKTREHVEVTNLHEKDELAWVKFENGGMVILSNDLENITIKNTDGSESTYDKDLKQVYHKFSNGDKVYFYKVGNRELAMKVCTNGDIRHYYCMPDIKGDGIFYNWYCNLPAEKTGV